MLKPMSTAANTAQQTFAEQMIGQKIDRIAAVDPAHAETMRHHRTSFEITRLPFYRSASLLRARVHLPNRMLELRYAEEGDQVRSIARGDQLEALNRDQKLDLTSDQAASYLAFYMESAGPKEYRLVRTPEEIRWLPRSSIDADLIARREAASQKIRPLRVHGEVEGAHRVTATALRAQDLVELSFSVNRRGKVELLGTTVLMTNLPVPYVV